jgi:hypothetical protein
MKIIVLITTLFTITFSQYTASNDGVENVLNSLHLYASEANGEKYFNLFSEDAVFFGTDMSERWNLDEFKAYGMPIFEKGSGWTYIMTTRNIFFSDDGKTAWFDEVLTNKKYGDFRGTGVLKIVGSEWKIAQYNLLLPIPNDLMMKYSKEIKDYYHQK